MRNFSILLAILFQFCLAANAQKYPKTFLWEISGNELQKPSYLFGTFHITQKEVFEVNDSVLSKLVQSDAFANEVNMDSLSILIDDLVKTSKLEFKVSELLSKEELKRLDVFLKRNTKTSLKEMGDPTANDVYNQISRFKHNKDGMKTMLDGWLYNIARNHSKNIFGIENAVESMERLKQYPKEEQRELIISVIDSMDMISETEAKMLRIYLDQDLDGINELINTKSSEFTTEVLLNERNFGMVKNMTDIMKVQSCFFAVGAAHLPGEKGLIALLEKKGFKVSPIVAPKTGYYKKFLQESSGPKWEKFTDKENGYSLEMPGKPGPIAFGDYKMHGYFDVGTGQIYFTVAFPVQAKNLTTDHDEILKNIEKNLSSKGKVSNKQKVTYKNLDGIDMDVINDQFKMRMRILFSQENVYMLLQGEQSQDKSKPGYPDKFFNSVEFFTPPEIQYTEFLSDTGAFKMMLPDNVELTELSSKDNFNHRNFVAKDKKSKITFTIGYFDYGFGKYFDDSEKIFSILLGTVGNKFKGAEEAKKISFSGYPAREQVIKSSTEYSKIIYVLRENRLYTIVAETIDFSKSNLVDSLIKSFRFIPYINKPLHAFNSAEGDFSILFPDKMHEGPLKANNSEGDTEEDVDTITRYFYTLDPFSSFSFNVICEEYGKYHYSSVSDSVFLYDILKRIYPDDSVVKSKIKRDPSDIRLTAKVQFSKNPNMSSYTAFVLTGNKIYTIVSYLPTDHYGDSLGYAFLNSFLLKKPSDVTIFTSQLSGILKDLQSNDTSITHPLIETFDQYDIPVKDTSILIGALGKRYSDDNDSGRTIRYCIYEKLLTIFPDSSKAADYVRRNYQAMSGRNDNLKLLALAYLIQVPSAENYSLVKKILITEKPHFIYKEYSYKNVAKSDLSIESIFIPLYEPVNKLTKSFYPEFLSLADDEWYTVAVYRTTARLYVDSVLTSDDLNFARKDFLKRINRDLNVMLTDSVDNTFNYESNFANIQRILSGYNEPEILEINKKVISENLFYHYATAISYLAARDIRIDQKKLDSYIALPNFRYALWDALNEAGKTEWYPQKYIEQKYFAENDLYDILSDDDSEPESIKFVEKMPVKYNDEMMSMYVFKIFYTDEDENKQVPYLAWAGPYNDNSKPDLDSGDLTGSNYDKWDDKDYRQQVLNAVEAGVE